MPRYRACIEYTDKEGRERKEQIEFDSASDNAVDVAQAAQREWEGFQQSGEERLPHNIEWEQLG